MSKFSLSNYEKRLKIDRVASIIKRICGVSQSEAFVIAKDACIFNAPVRYAGGKFASRKA